MKKKVKKFITFNAIKAMFPHTKIYPICIVLGEGRANGKAYTKVAVLNEDGTICSNGVCIYNEYVIEPSKLKKNKDFDWDKYEKLVNTYGY